MPPKQKITREEILQAAYELTLEKGCSSLSSRNVANAAGCSVQPVFTNFPSMDCLRREVYTYACQKCAEEVLDHSDESDMPTVLTLWMLDLAQHRPNLFEFLYLSDLSTYHIRSEEMLSLDNHRTMIRLISESYGLSWEDSVDLLIRSCIFLMGIGTIICVDKVDISQDLALKLMRTTVEDFVNGVRRRDAASE